MWPTGPDPAHVAIAYQTPSELASCPGGGSAHIRADPQDPARFFSSREGWQAAGGAVTGCKDIKTWDRPEQDARSVDSGQLATQIRPEGSLASLPTRLAEQRRPVPNRADTHVGPGRVPTRRPTRKPSAEGEYYLFPLDGLFIDIPPQIPAQKKPRSLCVSRIFPRDERPVAVMPIARAPPPRAS